MSKRPTPPKPRACEVWGFSFVYAGRISSKLGLDNRREVRYSRDVNDKHTFNGSEIGSVRFNIDGDDIQYRVFRTETGSVVIYFIERRGYDCSAEVYEYDNLEEAKEHYAFILRRAGVI